MRRISRKPFFDEFKRLLGTIRRDQVAPLDALLDFLERDPHVTHIPDAAYLLATAYHETAGTFRPVREYGGRARAERMYGYLTSLGKRLGNDAPGEGAAYMGAGFVQLTGETNYGRAEAEMRRQYPDVVARFEARTGKRFDLTVGDQEGDEADPDNAMDPEIAYCILSAGCRQGWFGKRMTDYTHKSPPDYKNARRSVNGTDAAEKIAGHARKLEAALRSAVAAGEEMGLKEQEPSLSPIPQPPSPNADLPALDGTPAPAPDPAPSPAPSADVTIQGNENVTVTAPGPTAPVPGGGPHDKPKSVTGRVWVRIVALVSMITGGTVADTVVNKAAERPELAEKLLKPELFIALGVVVAVLVAGFFLYEMFIGGKVADAASRPDRQNIT